MPLETVPFAGWQNNARLYNADAELIVTLDVGPRIISYRSLPNGESLFKNYAAQMGGRNETEWKIRGGHRFWIAPENAVKTYDLDNTPVRFEAPVGAENTLVVCHDACVPWWLEKTMTITLAASGTLVTVDHRVVNRGTDPVQLAPWSLTVMDAGGLGITPQPALGEHPRDLAPNRRFIVWPFTDLTDDRWKLGPRLITLRQDAAGGPTKLGLTLQEGWAGYLRGNRFFMKTVPYHPGQTYADDGSNFETFTNTEMLEIETLGPLVTLAAGEEANHQERWCLHAFDDAPDISDEAALADRLTAVVRASELLRQDV